MAKQIIKTTTSPLVAALIATFEPLQKELDKFYEPTMGHEAPSVGNGYFKLIVGMHCQQVHRMLFSDQNSTEATNFDTVSTQIAKVSQNLETFIKTKYDGDWNAAEGDPNLIRQLEYIERLTVQEEVLTDTYDQYCTVYKHFFKEDWKPVARKTTTTAATSEKVKAGLEKVQARLAELANKNQTTAAA